MKISIITATFNSEKTLKDTLLSVEAQSYDNIEYIIVDGGSSDNTLQLVEQFSTRVTQIISEKDGGIYDALNKGIKIATGDIIGFLHSDDLFAYNDALKDVVEKFASTNCDAVYGDLEYVSQNDITKCIRLWKSGNFNRIKLQLGWMPPHPSFYMKRSCYQEHGCFSIDYKISADYDSLLRYILKKGILVSYVPKILVKMRVGGISNRSVSSMINKSLEDIRIMKQNNLIWPLVLAYKNLSKISQFIRK